MGEADGRGRGFGRGGVGAQLHCLQHLAIPLVRFLDQHLWRLGLDVLLRCGVEVSLAVLLNEILDPALPKLRAQRVLVVIVAVVEAVRVSIPRVLAIALRPVGVAHLNMVRHIGRVLDAILLSPAALSPGPRDTTRHQSVERSDLTRCPDAR